MTEHEKLTLDRLVRLDSILEVLSTNAALTAERVVTILDRLGERPPKQRPAPDVLRHVASRVDSLPFLRSAAAQHLERLQLLHDDVRALRGEILNLHDQSAIVASNVHHLASRIDGLQMLLPTIEHPESDCALGVTNPDDERQHIVDPIT